MRTVVWVVVLLTSMLACSQEPRQKPSRSECIVGFRLDWSGVRANRSDVINSLDVSPELFQSVSLATMSTPDSDHLYLQFYNKCQNRHELAAQLLSHWQGQEPTPRFVLIDEVICPSPMTIDARGTHWSDIDPSCSTADPSEEK